MAVFAHQTRVTPGREAVFAWHEAPGAFDRLMPPGTATITGGPTDGLRVGSRIGLRVTSPWLAGMVPKVRLLGRGQRVPLGMNWTLQHTEYRAGRAFTDEQLHGPFRTWRHEHTFVDAPDGGTIVRDLLHYDAPWPVADVGPERLLAGLFAFRADRLRDDLALHERIGGDPKHFLISGASGTVGTALVALLRSGGHRVTTLVRGEASGAAEVAWAPGREALSPGVLADVDVVINLAGEPIGGRFTASRKQEILDSRVQTTRTLVDALIKASPDGPRTLVNASAVGWYGPRRRGVALSEDEPAGSGFLAEVCSRWEAEADRASDVGVRVVKMRTGVVQGASAGPLALQLPLFLAGVGGRLGRPESMLSWIGLDDLTRAYAWVALREDVVGAVNAVAPHPVSNEAYADILGRVLGRPSRVPTPAFGPRLLLGAEGAAELVETDQDVSAAKLVASGFQFAHPRLDRALHHALLV